MGDNEDDKGFLKEEMTCGAPQGLRVGPLVWNVMYDDFLHMDLPAGTSIIGFADGDQTGRWTYRLIPELATWLDRKHGQVGFYLAQALSGHGCFNAYLKRFKKRDDESCRYCGSLVENAEHTLFVYWFVRGGFLVLTGMPRPVLGQSCTTSIKDFAIFPPHQKKEKKKKK